MTSDPLESPRTGLAAILRSVVELLSLPGNDFSWSSWADRDAALSEVEGLIERIDAGGLPDRASVAILFAPTGPLQEVSLSSGWADAFLDMANRYDRVARRLWA